MRALEIREEIAEKKHDELVNRERPMIPREIWRKKCNTGEESRAANKTIDDENSGNSEDIPTDVDGNVVFALPAEFRTPEA